MMIKKSIFDQRQLLSTQYTHYPGLHRRKVDFVMASEHYIVKIILCIANLALCCK